MRDGWKEKKFELEPEGSVFRASVYEICDIWRADVYVGAEAFDKGAYSPEYFEASKISARIRGNFYHNHERFEDAVNDAEAMLDAANDAFAAFASQRSNRVKSELPTFEEEPILRSLW